MLTCRVKAEAAFKAPESELARVEGETPAVRLKLLQKRIAAVPLTDLEANSGFLRRTQRRLLIGVEPRCS
jgi:hypothetical protein